MTEFFRYPRTPHLEWTGQGEPRDDKVLSPDEANVYFKGAVVVQEKVDGANLGISVAASGEVRVQNRGQYLMQPYGGQFSRLNAWLDGRRHTLVAALDPMLILFGEWCAARHSILYAGLPDWFLLFDVYDRSHRRFWSTYRVSQLAKELAICVVPVIFHGKLTPQRLRKLAVSSPSNFGAPVMEGVVVRREDADWVLSKAKLVASQFVRKIDQHWSKRTVEWNQIARTA